MTRLYTVSDRVYFPGLVALINSLRLMGDEGEVVVLDLGLAPLQLAMLEGEATVVTVEEDLSENPLLVKPYPHLLSPEGTVVVIDSDIIVTAPLAPVIADADRGLVIVFTCTQDAQSRHPDWERVFGLAGPLRPGQRTVNSGFLAVSLAHWRDLLRRWWETTAVIPPDAPRTGGSPRERGGPFADGDQDALNALLMSEVSGEAIVIRQQEALDDLPRTRVVDATLLHCEFEGRRSELLHHIGTPKAWERRGWMRVRNDAYVKLLPRVLFASDVRIRLDPRAFPVWVRPTRTGLLVRVALDLLNRVARAAVHSTSGTTRQRLKALRRLLAGR